MALQITHFRVDVDGGEGLTFPCVTMLHRRGGGAPVLLRWVFQRTLEILLFRRTDGGSTGAIWKALHNTGLQSTSLLCDRKAVANGVLLAPELQQLMAAFKAALPPGQHDPSALGRIRSCTLLPLATAAAVCRQHGRSPASMGFLRAFHQQVPTGWELQAEAERDAADGVYDPVLRDRLDEHGFEAEELSIAQELTQVPEFVDAVDDETKLRTYALAPTASLRRQLAAFVCHRTATFAARRSGGAVQGVSAEANCTSFLRFLGWMQRTNQAPADAELDISFLARADLGTKAQEWAQWLQRTQRVRFTSICNYLSSLVTIANYVYFELHVDDEVLRLSPNPLEQLVNLRDQAHGAIKEQNLYTPANVKGGLITWPQAQETRVKVLSAVMARPPTATLKEAAMISLMTLIPPDRVGVVRRLRFQHTLKRRERCWAVDLSRRKDGHKTSKHYGPFHGELPASLNGVLDAYRDSLAFEPGGDEAYLFSPNDCFDRPLESSAWTAAVKRLFQKHCGQEISPKALRSSFITWLRDSTTCPEILKSAAHAQKHSERRQASDSYDTERDTRLCKAAFDFNSSFCASFAMPSVTAHQRASPAGARRGASSSNENNHANNANANSNTNANNNSANANHANANSNTNASANVVVASPVVAPSAMNLLQGNHGDGSGPAARRCVFAACPSDTPSEGLRECPCGSGPHHHFCSIAAGCEEDTSLCARCLGAPVVELAAVAPAGGAAADANGEATDAANGAAGEHGDPGNPGNAGNAGNAAAASGGTLGNDDAVAARLAALHCHWTDATQAELHGTAETDPCEVRELLDEMGRDSCTLVLLPEGKRWEFRRSERSGALQMTSQMVGPVWRQLEGGPWVGRLMRPSRQPVPHATYRNFYVAIGIDEDTPLVPGGQVRFPVVPGAPAEGVVCNVPSQWGSRCKQLVFPLKLNKNGCSATQVTIHAVEYRAPPCESEEDDDRLVEESEDDDDRPLGAASSVVPLAAVPPTVLAPPRSSSPHADRSSESSMARGRRRALDVLDAARPSKEAWAGLAAQPAPALAHAAADAASLVAHEPPIEADEAADTEEEEEEEEEWEEEEEEQQQQQEEEEPEQSQGTPMAAAEEQQGAPVQADEQRSEEAGEAEEPQGAPMAEPEEQPAEEAEEAEEEPVGGEPPPPPPQPQEEPGQPWRSVRKRKAKVVFGDNGELDGPASSFRSAPPARRPSVSLSEERGVPAFALPGEIVWAMGLHAGVRKRFRAEVIGTRRLFPRIVVKYLATESGGTHPLELPDPITAYLTMTDLEPGTLIPP